MRWALGAGVPVRFIDLAGGHPARALGGGGAPTLRSRAEGDGRATTDGDDAATPRARQRRRRPGASDPRAIRSASSAEAAGEADGERWWDRLVESRRTPGDAVRGDPRGDGRRPRRELPTRTRSRSARGRDAARDPRGGSARASSGSPSCAAPGTRRRSIDLPTRGRRQAAPQGAAAGRQDGRGLGAVDVRAASPPSPATAPGSSRPAGTSTSGRARSRSRSRGWPVARVFRDEDLDASAAHLIEAARLAETLAAMRGRRCRRSRSSTRRCAPSIAFGSDVPLALVRDRLIVGRAMGEVPADAPARPARRGPRARDAAPAPEAARARQKPIDLDLRTETDLARSHLLHRLRICWACRGAAASSVRGHDAARSTSSGTLAWKPEFAVDLVAASRYGNTIEEAAAAKAIERRRRAADGCPR